MAAHSIRNVADYQMVRESVSALVDVDPQSGTADADRLEALGTLLQAYEARHYPLVLPDAVGSNQSRKDRNS